MSDREQLLPQTQSPPPIWGPHAQTSDLDVVIFSKDRAMQLDALLRSIRAFMPLPHRMHVVYNASNDHYEEGYNLLRRWHPRINWVCDKDLFQSCVHVLLHQIRQGPGKYLMFLVDDMLFTRPFTAAALMTNLESDEDILAVSLRMSEDIRYCYTRNIDTTPPDFSNGYRWTWKGASPGYWNYPMSLDGNIYRTRDIVRLIRELQFQSPNTLEAAMAGRALKRPDMLCEQRASVINVADNRVQEQFKNRSGDGDPAALNAALLAGQAIDVEHFAKRSFNSCHIVEALPLMRDNRYRERAPLVTREHDGRVTRVIDLREIPVFILNCPDDEDKRQKMEAQMLAHGIHHEFVDGLRVDPGWVGVALGHLKVLRLTRARPPFLVLEDDLLLKDNFQTTLEIPAEADAYYLGVSAFGMPKPGERGFGKPGKVQWQDYGEDHLRVFNMLARHAVLYLSEDFQQAAIQSQVQALSNHKYPHPGDMGLAALQTAYTVLTPRINVSRQVTREATDFNLPEAQPQNRLDRPPPNAATPVLRQRSMQLPHTPYFHETTCVVSHKYRFIYFSIAKNASSSLKNLLCAPPYNGVRVRFQKLDGSVLNHYFKFTFLRDPVARLCSAYQEISMRTDNRPTRVHKTFIEMPDGPNRFNTFVSEIGNGFWDEHLRYQVSFLNGIGMDFYGSTANLQDDLQALHNKLAMGECPEVPVRRSRASRQADYDYNKYYVDHNSLSDTLAQKIREIYWIDGELISAAKARKPEAPKRFKITSNNRSTDRDDDRSMWSDQSTPFEIETRGGHRFTLRLAKKLDEHAQLKTLIDKGIAANAGQILQLPMAGGEEALSISVSDISRVRRARQGEHPAMNVGEGHLGGYISSKHPAARKQRMEHGDNATWYPQLWQWIVEELGIDSVVDIGCGEGHAAAYFKKLGCEVIGVDGSELAVRDSEIPDSHVCHDFNRGPWIPEQAFDMVWSCEFAEHVEGRYTHNFLATCSRASRYIFWCAAPPGAPGWHHVNCKPAKYWIEKFDRLGFALDQALTDKARQLIGRPAHFQRQGLVFARKANRPAIQIADSQHSSRKVPQSTTEFSGRLCVNEMAVTRIDKHLFHLFLDVFVHAAGDRVTAVLPYYNEDWDPTEHGVDYDNVMLRVDDRSVRGTYIPHRLDSWEPCALIDFSAPWLSQLIEEQADIQCSIEVGPHHQDFSLSTATPPAFDTLISLVIKNENRWLPHFLVYYFECLHVDHILVYDNGTSDQAGLHDILAPYIDAGTVTYIPWDFRWRNINKPRKMIAQPQQEAHSLNRFANARWIGFLDIDEYLRIPGESLADFASRFEAADVDALSFGLRWFQYDGDESLEQLRNMPLAMLQSGRDKLGRGRQKLLVNPARMRFLRLHNVQEGGWELPIDDSDIFFHHYCLHPQRFINGMSDETLFDDYMLQFSGQLTLDQ